MKHRIHLSENISHKADVPLLNERIADRMAELESIIGRPEEELSMDVYLTPGPSVGYYSASAHFDLGGRYIYAKADSSSEDLVDLLIKEVKRSIVHQAIDHRRISLARLRERKKDMIRSFAFTLLAMKEKEEREQFDFLIKRLSPTMKGFVSTYLQYRREKMDPILTIDDLVDEIFLQIYERYEERPKDLDRLSEWIYEIAGETLEQAMKRQFLGKDAVRISELAKKELDEMEERFTTDGDGDLMMFEELDDISYSDHSYRAHTLPEDSLVVYPDDEALDAELQAILEDEPENVRIAFQLYWLRGMDSSEIASALDSRLELIQHNLSRVTERLLSQFKEVPA